VTAGVVHPAAAARPALSADAGFTLIEMLVAIALIGLLTAGLFGALRFGTRASSAVDRTLDHSRQLALVYGFLQSRLADAQPFPAGAAGDQGTIWFDGTPDALEFVSMAPMQLTAGGFFAVRIEPHPGGRGGGNSGGELVTTWRSVAGRNTAGIEPNLPPSVLLEHIAAAHFAYFGAHSAEDASGWHDRWHDTDHLPSMVRLRVDFADGWHSPDLIVAPRLATSPEQSG
jgi:general secretion pathway protein J